MIFAYRVTIFLSAFLLFQIQLIIGKRLLPWFGGAPAVLTTCMLFFQFGLIIAYYYADVLRQRSQSVSARVHCTVLWISLAIVAARMWTSGSAITPDESWKNHSGSPLLVILVLLAVVTGLPYFILGTTGPLLQAWFARLHSGDHVYRTYALSNAGSLMGLLTYPFIIERLLRLQNQARIWSALYVLFVISCTVATLLMARTINTRERTTGQMVKESSPPPGWRRSLEWFALAGCACGMLMAVTNQICQDVAAIPLLWVLPLTVYLLSLIACFESQRWYSSVWWAVGLAASTVLIAVLYRHGGINPVWQIAIYLFALLASCMVCHGEAARMKPSPAFLTRFYVLIAAGGVAGSAFVVLIAPLIFKTYFWELHLLLWVSWVLLVIARLRDASSWMRDRRPWLLAAAAAVICAGIFSSSALGIALLFSAIVLVSTAFLFTGRENEIRVTMKESAVRSGLALALMGFFLPVFAWARPVAAIRNFYGILTVVNRNDLGGPMYALMHGQTLHGAQFLSPPLRNTPTTYYGPKSGVGLLLTNHPKRLSGQPLRVGVIGLGAGTVAAYGKPGDYIRFYEINPADIRLAFSGAPPVFTFLRDSPARIEVIEGDARLRLEEELGNHAPQKFDILILDAFSGDAIPVHLLTGEALRVYLGHLSGPDAVLAFHISNRAVDLRPVLLGLAASYSFHAFLVENGNSPGSTLSSWVLVTRDPSAISGFADPGSELVGKKRVLWTDDFSSIFQIMR